MNENLINAQYTWSWIVQTRTSRMAVDGKLLDHFYVNIEKHHQQFTSIIAYAVLILAGVCSLLTFKLIVSSISNRLYDLFLEWSENCSLNTYHHFIMCYINQVRSINWIKLLWLSWHVMPLQQIDIRLLMRRQFAFHWPNSEWAMM